MNKMISKRTKPLYQRDYAKENLLVVINGVDKWIKNMKVEEKSNLATFFTEVSSLNNCNFIFLDRLTEIKPYAYESWFRFFC